MMTIEQIKEVLDGLKKGKELQLNTAENFWYNYGRPNNFEGFISGIFDTGAIFRVKPEITENKNNDELKNGDKVLFTTISGAVNKVEGRFVGYSNLDKTKCIVEYGNPFSTAIAIAYDLTCEKKPEPKKRLMTAKELVGKFVRFNEKEAVYLARFVESYPGSKMQCRGFNIEINKNLEYTSPPADDSSWKSVEVDE